MQQQSYVTVFLGEEVDVSDSDTADADDGTTPHNVRVAPEVLERCVLNADAAFYPVAPTYYALVPAPHKYTAHDAEMALRVLDSCWAHEPADQETAVVSAVDEMAQLMAAGEPHTTRYTQWVLADRERLRAAFLLASDWGAPLLRRLLYTAMNTVLTRRSPPEDAKRVGNVPLTATVAAGYESVDTVIMERAISDYAIGTFW